MARPYWSGQVQISLVAFGIKLFVATESKSEIRFHQISRKTGERVKYQKVSASAAEQQEATGEDTPAESRVQQSDIVKGYEFRKGEYVTIEPEEIAQLRVPSKHTIAIEQFVGLDELAPEYLEKPYFVVPENDLQAEAFGTVREALRQTKKAALGKIAFGGREHVIAITADDDDKLGGMMGYTMRYQEELRDPKEYFAEVKKVEVNEESLGLAMDLIKRKAAKFDPSKFKDGYEVALKELVEAKVNHQPVPKDEPVAPARGKVVNLMDALRKSVGKVGAEEAPAAVERAEKKAAKAPKPAAEAKEGIALVKSGEKAPAAKAAKAGGKKRSA
ncbi:MAG: Ku protein [Acidobacteriaceae bacterium]